MRTAFRAIESSGGANFALLLLEHLKEVPFGPIVFVIRVSNGDNEESDATDEEEDHKAERNGFKVHLLLALFAPLAAL